MGRLYRFRIFCASCLVRLACCLAGGDLRPVRRVSEVSVVGVRKQARIGRRMSKIRADVDAYDACVRWGQKQCVARSVDVLRDLWRDYFVFDVRTDGNGDIIVRSTLKVLKDNGRF